MFDLSNIFGEPLVGRKYSIYLFSLSQIEFIKHENFKQTSENLKQSLFFEGYPELTLYDNWNDKKEYLYCKLLFVERYFNI
jgi:hypothetical protein